MPPAQAAVAEASAGFRTAVRLYLAIWATLLGLTGVSLGLAFLPLGPFNLVAALAIAVGQIVLLGLFFMSLRHASMLILITAGSGFVFLLSMFVLTLNDLFSRV